MFKSFFPKPGPFFISAFIWSLLAVIFLAGGRRRLAAAGHRGIAKCGDQRGALLVAQLSGVLRLLSVLRRRVRAVLVCLLPAPLAVLVDSRHLAHHLRHLGFWWKSGWRSTPRYAPFYDLIQSALATPHKVSINQFYQEIGVFLGIAIIAVIIGVMNNFFVSHYVFRWRTAMNEHYMAHWQHLRHIEGAAQRVQEDTMRFASTLEDMGVSFINAVMTLIAFLPVLVTLSEHVPDLPIVGHLPYGLGDCRYRLVADGYRPAGGGGD